MTFSKNDKNVWSIIGQAIVFFAGWIETVVYPDMWKKSNIVLEHRKGDKLNKYPADTDVFKTPLGRLKKVTTSYD